MKHFITLIYSYEHHAEDENLHEDDDEEYEINFVIEDDNEGENSQPGERQLIRSKMKNKPPAIEHGLRIQNKMFRWTKMTKFFEETKILSHKNLFQLKFSPTSFYPLL